MYTTCSNVKNICILTHSEICVLHTSHKKKKCEFFFPAKTLSLFLCNGDSILCDVYSKAFYKILNFRRLPISAVLSMKVPRDRTSDHEALGRLDDNRKRTDCFIL